MKILVRRIGSGQVLHEAEHHGISSFKTSCGRILPRVTSSVVTNPNWTAPRGTVQCPRCVPSEVVR